MNYTNVQHYLTERYEHHSQKALQSQREGHWMEMVLHKALGEEYQRIYQHFYTQEKQSPRQFKGRETELWCGGER